LIMPTGLGFATRPRSFYSGFHQFSEILNKNVEILYYVSCVLYLHSCYIQMRALGTRIYFFIFPRALLSVLRGCNPRHRALIVSVFRGIFPAVCYCQAFHIALRLLFLKVLRSQRSKCKRVSVEVVYRILSVVENSHMACL